MKKLLNILLATGIAVILPAVVYATTFVVPQGGTGASSFGQGWLYSDGLNSGSNPLNSSTSPTVNYIVATSTTKASRFPYASTTMISSQTASTTNQFVSSLAKVSGTFVAADPTGKLISTTTPSSGGTPGGSNTDVQFNDSSAFGGDSDLTWDKSTNTLTFSGNSNISDNGSQFVIANPTPTGALQLNNLGGLAGLNLYGGSINGTSVSNINLTAATDVNITSGSSANTITLGDGGATSMVMNPSDSSVNFNSSNVVAQAPDKNDAMVMTTANVFSNGDSTPFQPFSVVTYKSNLNYGDGVFGLDGIIEYATHDGHILGGTDQLGRWWVDPTDAGHNPGSYDDAMIVAARSIDSGVLHLFGLSGQGGNYLSINDDGGSGSLSIDSGYNINLSGGINAGATIGTMGDLTSSGDVCSSTYCMNSLPTATISSILGSSNSWTNTNGFSSTVTLSGNVTLNGASNSIVTSSISGAIVGIGCDTADTTGLSGLASTTAFITTPESFPGTGLNFYSMARNSTTIRTYVCSDVTVTPNASTYVVKLIR